MAFVRLHSTRDFFKILYSWKWQSLFVFVMTIAFIMLFAYIYTPDYTTTAKVMVLPHSNDELVVSANESKNMIFPVSIQDVNTEIELLTSTGVIRDTVLSFAKETRGSKSGSIGLKAESTSRLDQIIDEIKYQINELLIRLKLKQRMSQFEANVALLTDSLEVEPVAASNIILVSIEAEMPRVATIVLNRLLEVYIDHHNKSFSKEEGVAFLNNEALTYYTKLVQTEKKIKEFEKEWNIVDLRKQIESNMALLDDLTKDLTQKETMYESIKNRISILKEDMGKGGADFVITKDMRSIPAVIELEKSIAPLLVTRTEMLKTCQPSCRELKDLESQISLLKEERKKEILSAVKTDEMEMATLMVQKDSFATQIAQLQAENILLNQKELELANLNRDASMLEANYKLYASKTEEARINKDRKQHALANVCIADKAVVPVKPSFPNRLIMLVVAVFVAFFAALGTPFILEFIDHRIKTTGEAEGILALPVVCYLTQEKAGLLRFIPGQLIEMLARYFKSGQTALSTAHIFEKPQNVEQLSNLAQQIAFYRKTHNYKVFHITSSHNGEGVSSIVAGLAKVMLKNESTRNFLLVDANFPNPVQHSLFNTPASPGFRDALLASSFSESGYAIQSDTVKLMPCGSGEIDLSSATGQDKLTTFIEAVKKQYDCIILDSPPLLVCADSLSLAVAADVTFLVIQSRRTLWEVAYKSKSYLEKNGCRIGGVILNRIVHVIPELLYKRI